MAYVSVSWTAPASWTGISGHRIHAGKVSGVWTHVSSNIPAPGTSGTVTVPTAGSWYVAVAAYDASGYEGTYSTPILKATGGAVLPPVATIVASLR